MFKKLRNKFLILNLVTISVMMLLAFASIYIITYRNVRASIDMELYKISNFNPRNDYDPHRQRPEYDNERSPISRSVSFTLITDSQLNITNTISIFDMDQEFYETAKNTALSKSSNRGDFKQDGTLWTFLVKQDSNGYRVTFLDITQQQGILTTLIYTFVIVALIMLIIIFFISKFFADRSIKPVSEAFVKQKQFIADASHELKTPLAVIHTNVDVVLSNSEDRVENQSKWLQYIKSEADRMTKLTNNLLYLTQIDYSEFKMILTDFTISDTLENAILTMEAVIFENNLSLDYRIDPDLITYGNNEQIQQVIMILLDNAVKYTNQKGKIDISLKGNQNTVVLTVNNTGTGIPKEDIDKVFDRFYRTDRSRSRESGGHGLGLAIAKTIVEQNKGKIYVKSIQHESTSFIVELPRVYQ